MNTILAYAEAADNSGSGMVLIVASVAIIAVAAVLALVPVRLARSHRHKGFEAIMGFSVLWAIVAASVGISVTMTQTKWRKDQMSLIMSGYYDPANAADAPKQPWGVWGGVAAAYAGLIAWACPRGRSRTTPLLFALVSIAAISRSTRAEVPQAPVVVSPSTRPSLTPDEQKAGWLLLFDGESLKGWRGLGTDKFPVNRWEVRDGCLHGIGGEGTTNDLITEKKYASFELTFDWMIPKSSGNSGVKYRIQEKKGDGFAFGPEFQLMNDPGVVDKHATGSLYDLIPPKDKKLLSDGQFNHCKLVVNGNHVEHWLNGVQVVAFDFGSDALKTAIAQSKFKNSPEWGRDALGHIALQDHHDQVYFRNLKLRELQPAKE